MEQRKNLSVGDIEALARELTVDDGAVNDEAQESRSGDLYGSQQATASGNTHRGQRMTYTNASLSLIDL